MSTKQVSFSMRKVDDLIPYARNARTHTPEQVAKIAGSIKEFGFLNPVIISSDGGILAGHGRVLAAQKLGLKEVPCVEENHLSETQKRAYILADNRLALDAGWDEEMLRVEIKGLIDSGYDAEITGFTEDELRRYTNEIDEYMSETMDESTDGSESESQKGCLVHDFVVPPFSILDARQGYWQERKKEWLKIVPDTGQTREGMTFGDFDEKKGLKSVSSVSIFDPVLAEVVYKWFTPSLSDEKICVCDPFAGGLSIGFVSAALGGQFTGTELRQKQADFNNANTPSGATYICDDGQNIAKHIQPESQDLLFSCPPYFNLEKYSDLPNDASNQDYDGFLRIYRNALLGALSCLKQNRFAVIVMSNVRDKQGFYHDICADTTRIMADGGAYLYNDIILINPVGTAAIRARGQFRTRKVVRSHQNVLVYFKGDPKRIKDEFPELPDVDFASVEQTDD